MIALLFLIILSLLVSLDGFVVGFLFGLKRIRISFVMVAIISLFSCFVILFSMTIGRFLGEFIPTSIIQTLSGLLLIGIGIYNLLSELPLYRRSYFLMITLLMNVDSIGYGIQAGIAERSFWFAPLAGLLIFFAFIIGVIKGQQTRNRVFIKYVTLLPSLLFLLLGFSKIFF